MRVTVEELQKNFITYLKLASTEGTPKLVVEVLSRSTQKQGFNFKT